MNEVFAAAAGLLSQGEDLALARIVHVKGSAPREAGTGMLIRRNGGIEGTIGGGLIEATALKKAAEIFTQGGYVRLAFDMTSVDLTPADMVCGGTAEILIEYLPADAETKGLFGHIQACRRHNHRAYLATELPPDSRGYGTLQHYLISPHTTCATGSGGSAAVPDRLRDAVHALAESAQVEIEGEHYWVDILRNTGVVYIFGAGHISREVNDLAQRVGFTTIVLDDRAEFANHGRFRPPAEVVVLKSFDDCLQGLQPDQDSYLVIVTRGHLYDKTVLAQSLSTQAFYIGMIGSKRKKEAVFRALLAEGLTQHDLNRVHCPIGLSIRTETPAEIAVSIVGELIDVRARKNNAG